MYNLARQEVSRRSSEGMKEASYMPIRRQWQRGSIRKKNGKWTLRYREYVYDSKGILAVQQRTRMLLPANRTKTEARRMADQWLAQSQAPWEYRRSSITLREFWDESFVPNFLPNRKHSTGKLYRLLAEKHLLPAFGGLMLDEVSRPDIQRFIQFKCQSGYSAQTVRHLRNLLSNIFTKARLWGYSGPDNPAQYVEVPRMVRVRSARVLTPDEVSRLAGALSGPTRTIFLLCVFTGIRIGEALALQVKDVDLLQGAFHVRRDVYQGVVDTPKTERSQRMIPLSQPIMEGITRWLAQRPGGSEWLFPSEAGTPYSDRNLLTRKVWPICDKLGIKRFGWHSLRHTFATCGGDSGVPVSVLQAILGHTTLDTTWLYLHSMHNAKRTAVEQVARHLWPTVAQVRKSEQGDRQVIN